MGAEAAGDRRSFLRRGLLQLGRALVGAVEGTITSAGGAARYHRPPGAIPEAAFLLTCQRCGKCGEACPKQAIRYLPAEKGTAVGTPYIDPINQPCTLCLDCTRVCPSGALQALTDPRQAKMGTARIVESRCWAHKGQVCDLCYQQCPLPDVAITMTAAGLPRIYSDACTGCGICVWVCPSTPPAIAIDL